VEDRRVLSRRTPMAAEHDDGRELLLRLVGSCVALARLAGGVIRDVQRGRELGGEGTLGASLKDAADDRSVLTTADVRAQKVIVDGLRSEFPGVVLVGEEDELDPSSADALADAASWWPKAAASETELAYRLADLPNEYRGIQLTELVVFIDPLDGTREFVQGRLDSVQTLIGVAWRGRPIAGCVGLPFHESFAGVTPAGAASSAAGCVLHGIVGGGCFIPRAAGRDDESGCRSRLTCAASKSVKEAVLVKAHEIVGGDILVAGGCGNKVLRLLTGDADVTLFNLGTSLWDSCATQAVLAASGGTLTNLLGTPIEHTDKVPTPNKLGVVATASTYEARSGRTHRQLCETLSRELNSELVELIGGGLVSAISRPEMSQLATRKPRVGILGSTRGTNTLHIYEEIAAGRFDAEVAVVISNISKAVILSRARAAGVPAVHVLGKGRTREEFDAEVNEVLARHGCDIVLLVGFMRILSPVFCEAWKGRAVNVHPSLLPKHAALMDLEVHQSVLDAGDTESGCTVHLVDSIVDAGNIIVQPSVAVASDDTAETLKGKVQALEAPALVEAVRKFARNGFSLSDGSAHAVAPAPQPQALDIVRSINGLHFTAQELGEVVGCGSGAVVSFSCPEAGAVRYKQSVAARVYLTPLAASDAMPTKRQRTSGAGGASVGAAPPPASVFYKRAVPRELPYAMTKHVKHPYKTPRDAKANRTEASFLQSDLPRALQQQAEGLITLALPYRVEQTSPPDNPIDSRFALCLYDFAPSLGWYQTPHLQEMELRATLRVLADWHAFFWLAHDPTHAKAELASQLWETGSYWHLGQQPAGQIAKLRPNFERLRAEFDWPTAWDLGARLERVALKASQLAHGLDVNNKKLQVDGAGTWANAAYQTIIHGDPKAPNLFFRRGRSVAVVDEKAAGAVPEPEVGLIDMQWCGRGIGAVDVVYCIAASIDPKLIPEGTGGAVALVQSLVDEYHSTLLASFIKSGVASDAAAASAVLPAKVFQEQFEWAWLDLARVCVGDHWGSVTKEVLAARRGKMSFNAYNKSEAVARMVAGLTDVFLKRREQAADGQASL
jgi:phosphoribosylglycinamide formyltransferase-1